MSELDMARSATEGNILDRIADLQRRIGILERGNAQVSELSELSADLGLIMEGEFRSPLDPLVPVEPGDGFSGVRIKGEGMDYGGVNYAIACVLNDALGLGLALDGTGVFAGGAATIGALGILVNGLNYIYRHTAVNAGNTRIGKMSMTLEDDGTVPILAFDLNADAGAELLQNGDAEHGNFTHWTKTTETNGAWSVGAVKYAGTYGFNWVPNEPTSLGVLTSDRVAVTAGLDYLISGYELVSTTLLSTAACKVEVKWYDHASAGNLLRTDLMYTGSPISWINSEKTIEAPATALSVAMVLTATGG